MDGDRHRKAGFLTRRDAERWLRDTIRAHDTGKLAAPSRLTLGAYVTDVWLPGYAQRVKSSSYESAERHLRVYVVPRLGGIRLQALTAADVEPLWGSLTRVYRGKGEPLAPGTVAAISTTLRQCLNDAVRRHHVLRVSPLAYAPAPPQGGDEMTVWSLDEGNTFLAATAGDRLAPLWRLLLATGLRRGEVLGLRWRDLDLDAGTLKVERSLVSRTVTGLATVHPPKTRASRRTVTLDPETITHLRHWRARLGTEELTRIAPDAWVFADEAGRCLDPTSVSEWFKAAARGADVPVIRLHDTRHTHASWLFGAGASPAEVQHRLGHETAAITLSTYTRLLGHEGAAAAARVASLLR